MHPTQQDASRFAVSLIMERRIARQGPWSYPRWSAVGVVAGQSPGAADPAGRRPVRASAEGVEQFVWSGLRVELHRDSAESYWHNLVGRNPSLFIACREDGGGELEPFCVTANYDEAGAYMEADDTVFSVPMPPEIYRWLEEYVVANYRPEAPKKRQRKRWVEDTVRGA